jgi:Tol biopolymer transport system component
VTQAATPLLVGRRWWHTPGTRPGGAGMAVSWRSWVAVVGLLPLLGGCAWITRASVDPDGGDADGDSDAQSISADGRYVAFHSFASDLAPGDGNFAFDVFVRDTRANTTIRVSVDTTGGDTDASSVQPSISADGRFVAFQSEASDLVAGDGNGVGDVFVRDLQTATTTRVSVDTGGLDSNERSAFPSISADGRHVAFPSSASDLVSGDGNGVEDVFVRDLQTATTTRVSVDTGGGDPNGRSTSPSTNADGRYVAFMSDASDLVAGDGNGADDVFVRDLQTATTARVSVDTAGGDADAASVFPEINGSGRYVAFNSDASDLVTGDGNINRDVFVRDLQAGTTSRVSVDTDGGDPDGASGFPSISADGRYIAFNSDASDLVVGDTNQAGDVFVHDRQTGTTTRASVDVFGRQVDFHGDQTLGQTTSLTADGRYIAFDSNAPALIPDDGDNLRDIFVRVAVRPTVETVTPNTVARGTAATLTVTGTGFLADARAFPHPGDGVTVNSVTVLSETTLEVSMNIAADAPTGTRHVVVLNPGTGPGDGANALGACGNCLTIT